MRQLNPGAFLNNHDLVTIHGEALHVPDSERSIHLQFRRYAGCPVCNMHLRSIVERHDEILAAGIREVVVFHSTAKNMRDFQGELPFAAIADPDRVLYRKFGVQKMSPTAALSRRSWRAAARSLWDAPSLRGVAGITESHLGLPAEFLIDTDGRIVAAKYGRYIDDHWSVDELVSLTGGR